MKRYLTIFSVLSLFLWPYYWPFGRYPVPIEMKKPDSDKVKIVVITDDDSLREEIFWKLASVGLAKELSFLTDQPSQEANKFMIGVHKDSLSLALYEWRKVKSYPISSGANPGDKRLVGDCRTPEGRFFIEQVQKCASWMYKGERAYGPLFLRLHTPTWSGIGIHGSNHPELVGKSNASHGCIRMQNQDLLDLYGKLGKHAVGSPVFISP